VVKLLGFKPFTSAANALEQINSISEGAARSPGRRPGGAFPDMRVPPGARSTAPRRPRGFVQWRRGDPLIRVAGDATHGRVAPVDPHITASTRQPRRRTTQHDRRTKTTPSREKGRPWSPGRGERGSDSDISIYAWAERRRLHCVHADLVDNVTYTTGLLSDDLKAFLEVTLPKVKGDKKPKFKLGVTEPKLGAAILEVCAPPRLDNAALSLTSTARRMGEM
jgi:hypothetical protein